MSVNYRLKFIGKAEPLHRLIVVLRDAVARPVQNAKHESSTAMVLFGGKAEPLGRLVIILRDTLAIHVNFAQHILGVGYTLLCERAAYDKGLTMVNTAIIRRHTPLDAPLLDTRDRIGRASCTGRTGRAGLALDSLGSSCAGLALRAFDIPRDQVLVAVTKSRPGNEANVTSRVIVIVIECNASEKNLDSVCG